MQVKLYLNYNENLRLLSAYQGGIGAMVRIDNSSYMTDHIFDGIRIMTGTHTELEIERSFKFTMPKPYSSCEIDDSSPMTSNSELYNLIAQSQFEYTQQLCFQQCFQKYTIKECNCAASTFVTLFNASLCESFKSVSCSLNVFKNKYMAKNFIHDHCFDLCPLECNRTQYKASVSSHQFMGDLYVDHIRKNKNLSADFITQTIDSDSVAQSISSINIFYDSLSFTLSNESPQMDIVALLGNIGGNLGLFLGMSMLSVCEIIEILIEIFLIKTKNQIHMN